MDNLVILPPNSSLQIPEGEKNIATVIDALPPVLQNIKVGDNLLLNILLATGENKTLSLVAEKGGEAALEKAEFPLTFTLPKELPEKLPISQIVVKVTEKMPDKAAVKLLSINNETPDKFFKLLQAGPQEKAPVVFPAADSPKPLPVLLPVRITAQQLPLPENVENIKINAVLEDINIPLSEAQKIEAEFHEAIQNIVNVLKPENMQTAKMPEDTLLKILEPLQNRQIAGVVKTDGNIRFIETPIGKIFPEDVSAKLPVEARVAVKLQNIFQEGAKLKLSDILPDFATIAKHGESQLPTFSKLEETPLLQKILQPLAGKPQQAVQILQKFPALNENMLPNLVNFMKAAVHEDISLWLGKKFVQELDDMGKQGKEAMNILNDLVAPPTGRNLQSWRVIEIPFYNGENISKIKVSVRRQEADDENEPSKRGKSGGTRFVVDTAFSKLGAFQFDGFAVANERRFDLIIRTSKPVDDDLYANIIRLFKTSLHQVDYHGNVNINVKENFIKICDTDSQMQMLPEGVYI